MNTDNAHQPRYNLRWLFDPYSLRMTEVEPTCASVKSDRRQSDQAIANLQASETTGLEQKSGDVSWRVSRKKFYVVVAIIITCIILVALLSIAALVVGLYYGSSQGSSQGTSFFAVAEKLSMGRINAGEILVFEKVITNERGAYNPYTGIFTAPARGTYELSATLTADNGEEIWVAFYVNNKSTANIYARGTDDRHDQGSQTIISELEKGDVVCLKANWGSWIYGDKATSFSGHLLK